jgi:FkbM family methyltransferase
MNLVRHFLKIVQKVLVSRYPYSRIGLLLGYTKLVYCSILHHKLGRQNNTHRFLGLSIEFFSYAELLALIEEIFIYQEYQFKCNNDSPSVIDCGSNIGFSILYFKKCYPLARIIAFEPDVDACAVLKKNLAVNKIQNVTVYNVALSDVSGQAKLFKDTTPSASLTTSLYQSGNRTNFKSVSMQTLSGFFHQKVDLIKMDVEGSEVKILEEIIASKKIGLVNEMIIEYHPHIAGLPAESFVAKLHDQNFLCSLTKTNARLNPKSVIIRARNQTVN